MSSSSGDGTISDYKWLGFDMDHALVRYKLPALLPLIFDAMRRFLVQERDYDESLLSEEFDYDPGFAQKGLVLEWSTGNFVKLSESGRVLRASHGKCVDNKAAGTHTDMFRLSDAH